MAWDGDHATAFEFPESALETGGAYEIDILCSEPFEARSLLIHPTDNQFIVSCELLAKTDGGQFESIRKFEFQRPPGGDMMDIGPLWDRVHPVEDPALIIPRDHVTDISKYLKDGTLDW